MASEPPAPGYRAGMAVKSCSSCGHDSLEPGFLADRGSPNGAFAQWFRGALETGAFGGAKRLGREYVAVHAFRCTRCHHLDLFTE